MSGAAAPDPAKAKKGAKPKTNEEILMGFQKLRGEQRFLSNKLTELELDLDDHKLVVEALKNLEGDRKCFKIVGGILCERTVKDVLPEVTANQQQIKQVIETISQQLVIKGTEINSYKDEYNITFGNVDDANNSAEGDGGHSTTSTGTTLIES